MNLLSVAIRNVRRNARRSVLSALALALSVTGIVFLFGFLDGLDDNLSTNVQNFISGQVRVRHEDFDTYEQLSPLHLSIEDAEAVRQQIEGHPAVGSAVARIPFGGLYFQDDDTFGVQLLAADFAHEERYLGISELLLEGRLPRAGANETLAGPGLLERFGLDIGDRLTVLVTTFARGSNAFTVEIVGIIDFPYSSLARSTLMVPLDRAQHYLRAGNAATEILVKLTDDYTPEQGKQELAALLGIEANTADGGTGSGSAADGGTGSGNAGGSGSGGGSPLAIKSWSEIGASAAILNSARISYIVIALILFVLASTVIINTTMMVIYERLPEIGMLGAIGMSSRQIVALFYLEALFLGALGAAAGTLLGAGLNVYFGFAGLDIGSQLPSEGGFEISTILYPKNNPFTVIGVFIYALGISGLATLFPSMRCAKIKPVEALRQE